MTTNKAKITVEQADAKLILLDKEVIKADQDKIRNVVLNLDKSVHDNAVQCLMHAEKHGDTSLMRRLLIEVLGTRTKATGYRTQGLINWMRKHSPMELKGDTINLTGTDGKGNKRPFKIEEANKTPFWNDPDNAERVARPVFQQTALAKVDQMVREVLAAAENTVNGKPVDVKKPFYDGIHMDTVVDFAQKVKAMRDALPKDETAAVRRAREQAKELIEFAEANDPTKDDLQQRAGGSAA